MAKEHANKLRQKRNGHANRVCLITPRGDWVETPENNLMNPTELIPGNTKDGSR